MPRYRRALVRGERAEHWEYADGILVLRHPRGTDLTEVPIAHLRTPAMDGHYARLATKTWVTQEAIDELRAIENGA